MKSKSKALKKWAKKHGYKVKKLKLKKAKPSDLRGFLSYPTPSNFLRVDDILSNRTPQTEAEIDDNYFKLHAALMGRPLAESVTTFNVAEDIRITALYGLGEDWPLDTTEIARD